MTDLYTAGFPLSAEPAPRTSVCIVSAPRMGPIGWHETGACYTCAICAMCVCDVCDVCALIGALTRTMLETSRPDPAAQCVRTYSVGV